MFKLIIKNADGSVYWSEKFRTMELLNLWLDEEKTRPYWKQDFTTEILDITPPPIVIPPEELLRRQTMQTLRDRLNALDGQTDVTAAELKELVRKFFKICKLKGLIDS